jgi:hypothetical protein
VQPGPFSGMSSALALRLGGARARRHFPIPPEWTGESIDSSCRGTASDKSKATSLLVFLEPLPLEGARYS